MVLASAIKYHYPVYKGLDQLFCDWTRSLSYRAIKLASQFCVKLRLQAQFLGKIHSILTKLLVSFIKILKTLDRVEG
jgi:hypothetical protein